MNLRLALVLGVMLTVIPDTDAGWGVGGCAVAQTYAPNYGTIHTGWDHRSDEPHVHGYFVNGVQIAGYNSETQVYRTYDAARNVWGKPQRAPWAKAEPCPESCPCESCGDGCECGRGKACGDTGCTCIATKSTKAGCPCGCGCVTCECAAKGPCDASCSCQVGRTSVVEARKEGQPDCVWAEEDGTLNYGIDRSKLRKDEQATINGRKATKLELIQALQAPEKGGSIPNDAGLLRLTVVADSKDALAKVQAQLAPQLAPLAGTQKTTGPFVQSMASTFLSFRLCFSRSRNRLASTAARPSSRQLCQPMPTLLFLLFARR